MRACLLPSPLRGEGLGVRGEQRYDLANVKFPTSKTVQA